MDSCDLFTHILQGWFTGTGAIIWLPQCQWSKSWCITLTSWWARWLVKIRRLDCLPNLLLRRRSNKTPTLHVTGLCEGNPPVTGGFPLQNASNAENVSIWWRHHALLVTCTVMPSAFLITYYTRWQKAWSHYTGNQLHTLSIDWLSHVSLSNEVIFCHDPVSQNIFHL